MKKYFLLFFLIIFSSSAYSQYAETIHFTHDGITVNGTISLPSNTGKHPVIIIVPGSGANDQDGTLQMIGANIACLYPGLLNQTLRPYKELADALVLKGYAVLRYDKLEYTYSSNISMLNPITFHKLWLPAESAINYVKTRTDIDTNAIVLIGHSEGSSLIPYISHGRNDIKALISIAGPRQPLDSLLAQQIVYITQTCGGDTAQAHTQASQILNYFANIRNNTWNAATPPIFGVSAAAWSDYVQAVDSVSINYNLCNLPTLFIGFDKDINVPPAELNRLRNEVIITNDFWSIPDLIHYMTPDNDPHISKTIADTINYWLGQKNLSVIQTSMRQENIRISPNPFTAQFSVEITHVHAKMTTISLTANDGKLLFEKNYENPSNSFSQKFVYPHLPAGFYYITIKEDNRVFTQKIIKE